MTEGHEHFILTINSSSIPENVAIGHPNQITVTIVDDDGKQALRANVVVCTFKVLENRLTNHNITIT